MTVTEYPLTESRLREQMRYLARRWDDTGNAVRDLMLGHLAHPSVPPAAGKHSMCGKCLPCLWEVYQNDLAVFDGLNGRPWAEPRDWRDIDEDGLTGAGDPAGEAWVLADMQVLAAEDALIFGPGGRKAGTS